MFTGIIQKVATVKEIRQLGPESILLRISNPYREESDPISLGESIATNGVCLTVTKFETQFASEPASDFLQFDLSPATLAVTALSRLKIGSKVNLERSLRMGDRLSGHWVQGHVDGTARVVAINEINEGFYDLEIEPLLVVGESPLMKYCVKKGSISVDGISLTIQELNEKTLKLQIIPHTWSETALSDLSIGDLVNIEVDLLAKYMERFQQYE